MNNTRKRVGIVGFGNLGQYIFKELQENDNYEVAFVWNRTKDSLHGKVSPNLVLDDLDSFKDRNADLIIEVAHPIITKTYGPMFLQYCDYFIGSPTALADRETEESIRESSTDHGAYIPVGALWGAEDIKRMADRGNLCGLKVTMTKHPTSFKLCGPLKDKCSAVKNSRTVLYEGPVRDLCSLAPNNVNTMAVACVAAQNLGFDGVVGSIVADPSLCDAHIVDIEVTGPENKTTGNRFTCVTRRNNPAPSGHVTGFATYTSFMSSILRSTGKGAGVHIC